jgi:hypothetical protein
MITTTDEGNFEEGEGQDLEDILKEIDEKFDEKDRRKEAKKEKKKKKKEDNKGKYSFIQSINQLILRFRSTTTTTNNNNNYRRNKTQCKLISIISRNSHLSLGRPNRRKKTNNNNKTRSSRK